MKSLLVRGLEIMMIRFGNILIWFLLMLFPFNIQTGQLPLLQVTQAIIPGICLYIPVIASNSGILRSRWSD